jgi:hypothetical protein
VFWGALQAPAQGRHHASTVCLAHTCSWSLATCPLSSSFSCSSCAVCCWRLILLRAALSRFLIMRSSCLANLSWSRRPEPFLPFAPLRCRTKHTHQSRDKNTSAPMMCQHKPAYARAMTKMYVADEGLKHSNEGCKHCAGNKSRVLATNHVCCWY